MSDPQVITFRPAPEQYAWTFGGAAPVTRVKPAAVLEVLTEDCFAGRVRSETDLVSEVCGLHRMDAYQLVTQVIEAPLANVCDPNHTSVAKLPKRYLPAADAAASAHTRLCALAANYRGS